MKQQQGVNFRRALPAFPESGAAPSPCLIAASIANHKRKFTPSELVKHSIWVLDYSMCFGIRCKVNYASSEWLDRPPGSAHLYPLGTPYWEDSNDNEIIVKSSFIMFSGGDCAGLKPMPSNRHGFARIQDNSGRLGELLVLAASSSALGDFWQGQSLLCQILSIVHSSKPVKGSDFERVIDSLDTASGQSFIDAVNKALMERLSSKASIASIAKELGVSPSTLAHKYKATTGESPMQALAGMKIGAAKGLLLKGEPLKGIASKFGYHDEFHFSKAFKSRTGLSPRDYLLSMKGL